MADKLPLHHKHGLMVWNGTAWVNASADSSGKLNVVSSGGGGGAATIADGADVAEGATTDTAITGDNTGTVSGKLRGLTKIFADVWDSVNHWLKVSVQGSVATTTGLSVPAHDYVSYTNTSSVVDTYVFKTGGSGGTTVATLTITYTDSSKAQVQSVEKT